MSIYFRKLVLLLSLVVLLHANTDILPAETLEKPLQLKVAKLLAEEKESLHAKKIFAVIMDTKSGKIMTMASSDSDKPASEIAGFLYEPGSVMKPVTLAMALESYGVQRDEKFPINSGKIKRNQYFTVRDDNNTTRQMTPEEIIISSSNVGITQVAWRIPGEIFWEKLKDFGFDQKSGIALPDDKAGRIRSESYYQKRLHRAHIGYGYGVLLTPLHLLRIYAAFANDGEAPQPTLGQDVGSTTVYFSSETTNVLKEALVKVVKEGTAQAAQRDGLYIGGKTGTTHRVSSGRYIDHYNSSFYGFVEDGTGESYTIGVIVLDLDKNGRYLASQTAVPIFGEVVDAMVSLSLLKR